MADTQQQTRAILGLKLRVKVNDLARMAEVQNQAEPVRVAIMDIIDELEGRDIIGYCCKNIDQIKTN